MTLPYNAKTWMQHAIALAYQGAFTTTPNPRVGCVIVSPDNHLIAEGFHRKAGEPHAEALALAQAGDSAQGSTVYVTLEPCSHTGRTPPCANALIEAKVKTVIVAMKDPDPRIAGQGTARLRAAGITVYENIETEAAANINPGFISRLTRQRPWVRLKAAMSLDGRLALANGVSQWLSNEVAREDVHRWRAQACAILTGSGTIQHDDPLLNVRLPEHVERQPKRIVLDSSGRLDANYRFWQYPGAIRCMANNISPLHTLKEVETWHLVLAEDKTLSLQDLWKQCYQHQLHEIHLEAGGKLLSKMLQEDWVDELLLYLAPQFLGADAQPLVQALNLTELAQAPRYQWHESQTVGNALRLRLFRQTPFQLWETWNKHATD